MMRKLLLIGVMMAAVILPAFSDMKEEIEKAKSKSYDEVSKVIRKNIDKRKKKAKDLEKLKQDLRTKDKDGDYPISLSVKNKDVDLTRNILSCMHDIEELYVPAKNEQGKSVEKSLLQIAAEDEGDRTVIMGLLLDNWNSKNYLDYSCDNDGQTALYTAISLGHKKIAYLLLEKGADPNITVKEGMYSNYNPLMIALSSDKYKNQDDRLDLVKKLVGNRANINYNSKTSGSSQGVTPLFLAVKNDYRDIVKFLLEKDVEVNAINTYEDRRKLLTFDVCTATALDYTCVNNNHDMIKLLLEKADNINVNSEFKSQQKNTIINQGTPLFWAVSHDSEEDVRLLLGKKADVNNSNNTYLYDDKKNLHLFDASALHLACFQGNEAIAKILIEQGADVNLPLRYEYTDYDGSKKIWECSLLHWAYDKGYEDLLVSLLKHGAEVNMQDAEGETVLHLAAEKGDYKTYSLLKEHGGDITIKNKAGEAPWKKFERYDKTAADKIRRYYENREQDISANTDLENFISSILPEYINHKTSDDSTMTVLQVAIANKDVSGAEKLIEKGADYTLSDKDGDNALDYAIKKDLSRLVEYLADKPKAISRKSVFNALDKMNQETAILLLKNGADYTLLNGKGSNVLDCAIDLGLKDVVEYLADKKNAMSKEVLFRALEKEDQRSALLLLEKAGLLKLKDGVAEKATLQDIVD